MSELESKFLHLFRKHVDLNFVLEGLESRDMALDKAQNLIQRLQNENHELAEDVDKLKTDKRTIKTLTAERDEGKKRCEKRADCCLIKLRHGPFSEHQAERGSHSRGTATHGSR